MPDTARQPEISYRPDIDGLRALAILSVVAYHVGLPWISGGFTGVDVFFVISGFLITQLLLKEAHSSGTISIANFYARRVRRLLPALATVMVVTLLAGAVFLPYFGERQDLAKSACASLVFAANHYFLASSGGYFDGPSDLLPLLHLWSLAVEEQFYLVWPLILIVVVKLSPVQTRIVRIRILIGILLTGSFLASCWLLRSHPQAAFFILPSRAWELGVGALLATVPPNTHTLSRRGIQNLAGFLGLVLLAWAFFAFNTATPFPGIAAAVPVIGSALLIVAGMAGRNNVVSRILSLKPTVTIGLLSYSWYLWHWPLLSIVRNRRIVESNVALDCVIALIALACAALTVRFIENPIRHHKGAPVARKTVLVGGLATLAVLLICSVAVGAWAKYGPQSKYTVMAFKERPPLHCILTARNWNGQIFFPKCDVPPPGKVVGESPLVVVWGDSQAHAWATSVRVQARQEMIEVQEFTLAACPPLLQTNVSTSIAPLAHCSDFNRKVIAGLKHLRAVAPQRKIAVVLMSRWPGYLGKMPIPVRDRAPLFPMFYSRPRSGVDENLSALRDGLVKTTSELSKLDMRILILLGGPEFRTAPIRCMAFGYDNGECDQPLRDIEDYRGPAAATIRRVAQDVPNIHVLDALPFFCPGVSCQAFMNGHPVVYDDSHISLSSATAFAPSLGPDLQWLVEDR